MMNKTWLVGGAGLAILVAGGLAVAFASDWQGPGGWMKGGHGRGHGGGRGGAVAHLLQFDADKDGRVTRAEIDAGLLAEFHSADTNGDGRLDAAEFQKFNDARKAERKARIEAWRAKHGGEGKAEGQWPADRGQRNFDPMRHMDWNLDGYITPDEFANRIRAQAMRADRDGDGTIQSDELKKGHGRGRHKGDTAAPATTAPAPEQQ